MALRKLIETSGDSVIFTEIGAIKNGVQNVTFSAYIKVEKIEGNKENITASVSFDGEQQRFTKQYSVPVSVGSGSSNFIEQTYSFLKNLPEFANATDC